MTFQTYVKDEQGNPVSCWVAAAIQETGQVFARNTDGRGYADLACPGVAVGSHVTFISNLEILKPQYEVIGSSDKEIQMVVDPPSFKWPSRDQSIAVKALFQGLQITTQTYGVVRNPGAFIFSLPDAERASARQQLRQALNAKPGEWVHDFRQVSYAYSEPDFTYPIPGRDFWKEGLGLFRALLLEDLQQGVIPIIELSGDGPTFDQYAYDHFGAYGFDWLMANMPELYGGIGLDVMNVCPTFGCWECITNGWGPNAPAMFEQCVLLQRKIAPDGVIAAYLGGYTWWGDADPHHDLGPVGDWQSEVGMSIDVNFEEGSYPFLDPHTGVPIQGDNLNGWEQRAWAHLENPNPALIAPQNRVQKEWLVPTPRGPRSSVANEYCTFQDDRGMVSAADVLRQREYLKSLGFLYVS